MITDPPILIPGSFTGPAPSATVLALRLNLAPGTTAAGIAQLNAVLLAEHIAVAAPDGGAIPFSATVAQVEALFGCRLDGYRLPNGTTEVAPVTEPRLPDSLAAHAVSVTGFYLPGQRTSGGRR